jgi:hypothetical protein
MASAALRRISKRRPSWLADTLLDCSRQQTHGYDPALSRIGRLDNQRRGSKPREPIRGPSRAPKSCGDFLYRWSGAERPPQDLKMLGVAGARVLAISKPINIVFYIQRQTIKNQKTLGDGDAWRRSRESPVADLQSCQFTKRLPSRRRAGCGVPYPSLRRRDFLQAIGDQIG